MKRTLRMVIAVGAAVAVALPAAGQAQEAEVEKSDNVKHLGNVNFTGGSELAASGKYLYAGEIDGDTNRGQDKEKGGMRIFNVSKGGKPKQVGFLRCPGNDNDVEVVKPGLVVMGFHQNACATPGSTGLMTIDVRNAKKPKVVGRVEITGLVHTLKPYPGTNLVYTSPGGLANGGGRTHVVDVSNPKKPEIVAEFKLHQMGCHDLSFHISKDRKLAFCSGYGETQIWDVEDPKSPSVIGHIVNPAIEFHHYAVASSDGKLLAIDDEAFAAHECVSGQTPTGRVWIYDISIPQVPVLQSSHAAQHGDSVIGHYAGWVPSWCLSHGLDWQPGTYNLGVTWFNGGVSVLNLDNPLLPEEVAYFKAEDSLTYSVLWHKGYMYTNDYGRGVDGFKISGLPK